MRPQYVSINTTANGSLLRDLTETIGAVELINSAKKGINVDGFLWNQHFLCTMYHGSVIQLVLWFGVC